MTPMIHELMHLDLRIEFPNHINSKAEETQCDCLSIQALDQAKYYRGGLIYLTRRFPKDINLPILAHLFDPHPTMQMREKNLSNALCIYEDKHGFQSDYRLKPLPQFIGDNKQSHKNNLRFCYFIDRQLQEKNYAHSLTQTKILIIAELIKTHAYL